MRRGALLSTAILFFTCAPAFGAIDYSVWELQEPDGTTVSSGQLSAGHTDPYFYTASDGGQVFMDTQTGTPTSGSLHPRCEMREMNGGSGAAWAPTGINTLSVAGKVLMLGSGSGGKTTVAQVFNSTGGIPLCELIYSGGLGGFEILYEEAKGAGSYINLGAPVALNTPYTFTLSLSNGVLTVSINGGVLYTHTPSAGVLSDSFYFKCGDYDQTAVSGTNTTVPYTEVEDTDVEVYHNSGTPTPSLSPSPSSTPTVPTPGATATRTASPAATATGSPSPTSTSTRTAGLSETATDSPSPTPTSTATRTAGLSETATDSPSPTLTSTATPTAGLSETATDSPSPTPTTTATPTAGISATATDSMSPTPSASETATAGLTATGTDSASPTPSATASPTQESTMSATKTETATSGGEVAAPTGGVNVILEALAEPDPNPRGVFVELGGSCDRIRVRVYTQAMTCVARFDLPGAYQAGWQRVALPQGWAAGLANGAYCLSLQSLRQGQVRSYPRPVMAYLLR